MNILIEINGEQYQGQAYQAQTGLVILAPGLQSPDAPAFDALFGAVPAGKASGGFVEVGEYNDEKGAYPFEGQVELCVGPDGWVWAQVGAPSELPPKTT